MINIELLRQFGAEDISLEKGETLFREGELPRFFFQVLEGEIRMSNINEDGHEFIQGIFSSNRSFGEPPLFGEFVYPAAAVANSNAVIIRLPKNKLFELLNANPEVNLLFTKVLAQRLYYKALMANGNTNNLPEVRITTLLNYLKKEIYKKIEPFSWEVNLTRQEIADLTGLRVETVIRCFKRMDDKKEVRIVNHKIWI